MLFVAPNEKDLVHQPDSKLERDGQICIQDLVAQLKTSSSPVTKMHTSAILLSEALGDRRECCRSAQPASCQSDCTLECKSSSPTPRAQMLGESEPLPCAQGGGVSPLASCSGILPRLLVVTALLFLNFQGEGREVPLSSRPEEVGVRNSV